MTDDRWRAAWDIYEAACELPAKDRRSFAAAANADSAVAAKVSALLDSLEAAAAAQPVADPNDDWPQLGRIFGRFTVTSALGRGATGEVYAGRDTELDRAVALKFIGPGILGSARAVSQMVREAQTASALNHPGIVTVYEVIRSGPALGIVMELVEGHSLRAFCGRPNLVTTVAEWGRQAAHAIAAAHANRIVHRDIKPENLMLRPDGYIKILDFGMARRFTDDEGNSTEGGAAGTLRYMSPEQVRGGQAHAPGDIFSLGIVLYELAAGIHPFRSASPLETPYAIAMQKPGSLRALEPGISTAFEDVILAMLDKNPAKRPGAAEVAKTLADLSAGAATKPAGIRLGRRRIAAAFALIVLSVVVGSYWLTERRHIVNPPRASIAVPVLATIPGTDSAGNEGNPAFSPDGTMFAYEWDRGQEGGNRAICVKPVVGGHPLVLTTGDDDFNPAWSPDGRQIAFLRHSRGSLSVVIVPAAGGEARTAGSIALSSRSSSHQLLAWMPDAASLIVSDEPAARRGDLQFFRLGIQTAEKTAFLSVPEGASDVAPEFSPNGKTLAFLRLRAGAPDQLMIADTIPGDVHALISSEAAINSFGWTPNGGAIVYSSGSPVPSRLWQVEVSGGGSIQKSPQPASFRLPSPARQMAIALQGKHLAYSRPLTDSDIWRLRPESGTGMERFMPSTREDLDPRYSPDGKRIAFASRRTESLEIWVAGRDGSDATQITFQGVASGSPSWSPNGKQIAFDSSTNLSGNPKAVWLVGADGAHPRRLAVEAGDSYNPSWSRDGAWVYFGSRRGGKSQIWKARVSGGGPPQAVTRNGGFEASETLDGKYLYYTKEYMTAGIWRMPVAGGDEERIPELDPVANHRYWEMAERGIYFVDSTGTPRLRFFEFATRQVKTLATLPEAPPRGSQPPSQIVRGLSAAPDGRSFLEVRYGSDRVAIVMAELP